MKSNTSALIFHNYHEKVASFVELTRPFMLLYESVDARNNVYNLIEFTDQGHYCVHTSFHELIQLGPQPLHKHEFIEITYVMSGRLHMQIENTNYYFSPGECCLCNQNTRHCEQNDSDCEYLLIMLQVPFLKQLLSLDRTENFHPLLTRFLHQDIKEYATLHATHFTQSFYDNNLRLINHTLQSLSEYSSGSQLYALGHLCQLLYRLQDPSLYHTVLHQANISQKEDLFIQLSLYLEANNGNVTRSELEKNIGYNGDYLTRIIKSFTGMNFITYAQEYSLKEAKNKLLNTQENIGDICLSLGYNNRTHFNKIFEKKYGMSPRAYRKQHQD